VNVEILPPENSDLAESQTQRGSQPEQLRVVVVGGLLLRQLLRRC
jgi:hypothetical protein